MTHIARLLLAASLAGCSVGDPDGDLDAILGPEEVGAPPLPFVALSADQQRPFDGVQADTIDSLGAAMVRLQICDWPASRDRVAAEVDAARAAGLAVYAEINYCTLPAPSDPAERQAWWHAGFTDAGNQFNWQFAAAAGEIAEALRGRVAAYEIWNEPDAAPRPRGFGGDVFWPTAESADWDGACGDYPYGVDYEQGAWALCPRQLATVTTNAFMAIRERDPAARIVAGNLLYHGDGGWVAKEYLRQVEAAPAVQWFRDQAADRFGQPVPWDLIGVHPYGLVPETGALERELADFGAITTEAGDPAALSMSEIGWHTDPAGDPYTATDEPGQAYRLHETLARARDAGVAFVVWFNYLDSDEYDLHFGVRRADGSWKDSAAALCDFTTTDRCPASR
jgi:hypothetical protein